MEKTKETELFDIESSSEASEFKRIATGRKFCKVGERLADIYDEEIERYKYENSKNIFVKIFKHNKYKTNSEKLTLESRIPSCLRAIIAECIRNDENKEKEEIIKQTKEIILDKVEKYNSKGKENKIIDINTVTKKEA